MSRKEEILEDNVHVVRGFIKRILDGQNGLIEPKALEEAKKDFLTFSTSHLIEEMITAQIGYPINDNVPVQLDMDMIIMRRADFAELLDILEKPASLPVGDSYQCSCGKTNINSIQHN